jgi:Bifunctional DNA primase/polymerase, N-terminal
MRGEGGGRMTQMLDHAAGYAAAGIAVLALKPRTKVPATEHGKDDATTDTETITRWWTRNPRCNIGLRPSPGILVVDIDPRNGGDLGIAERLPETWTAETGSGGLHIWLRATAGPWRSTLAQGIDLKTAAGYLVAPPSVHPSGNPYRWLNREPIAYAPGWLIAQATRPKPPPSQPFTDTAGRREAGLVAAVAEAAEGARNGVLYWAARRALEFGTYQHIRGSLADAARSAGLTDREIDTTLRSAERGHAA